MQELVFGAVIGLSAYFFVRVVLTGFFTVQQNERVVLTSFGRAQRVGSKTTLDLPIAHNLNDDQRERYSYPQLRTIGPGGPYLKWPWQKVHRVNVAIQTVNAAFDRRRQRLITTTRSWTPSRRIS